MVDAGEEKEGGGEKKRGKWEKDQRKEDSYTPQYFIM